jgi:hypothetical protein
MNPRSRVTQCDHRRFGPATSIAILYGMSQRSTRSKDTPREKAPKSAYELALERLERDGIDRPRTESLSDETKAQMAEARQRAKARVAELEIMHRDRLKEITDPGEREQAEKNFRSERTRIESGCEREVGRLRHDQE